MQGDKQPCTILVTMGKNREIHRTGELAERSNAAVLKTVDCNRSGGSNPSLSAIPRSDFLINSPNLSTTKPLVSGEFVLNSSRQKLFA